MKKLLVAALLLAMTLCAIGLVVLGNLPPPDPGRTSPPMASGNAAAELRRMLDAGSQAAADTAAIAPPVLPASAVIGAPPREWWLRPLAEVFDELRTSAERGDMEAAYVLGSRSADCMKTLRDDSPEILLEEYQQDIAVVEIGSAPSPEQRAQQNANRDRRFAYRLKQYEDCAVLGKDAFAGHLEWLERAGAAGVDQAQLAYARYALAEYKNDRGALIADIEQAAERRKRAAEWLGQLIADGNESALSMLVESPEISGLANDPAALMSYGYVLDLVRSRRTGTFPALWQEGPARYGDEFTARQWDDIAARGRRIFKQNFEDAPLWPDH